jgi:hypothetical protein
MVAENSLTASNGFEAFRLGAFGLWAVTTAAKHKASRGPAMSSLSIRVL